MVDFSSKETKKKIAIVVVFGTVILLSLLSIILFGFVLEEPNQSPSPSPPPTEPIPETYNLIFLIGDGFGPATVSLARYMQTNSTTLPIDEMLIGTVKTYDSQTLITDSAAAATSYSCGIKTYNEAIAVDDNLKACGTSMEAAKTLGMLTGLVVTSRITHATPAAFSSHVANRDEEDMIAEQQALDQHIDLLFGGGWNNFIRRPDGQNLFLAMENRGYQVIMNSTELEGELRLPLIGLFASGHLDYEIDRANQNPKTQPTLSEMVDKALQLLSAKATQEKKGFFLMIEGSRIDMAAHENDAYTCYLEAQQYLYAVDLVKKFVDEHPNTYVIATADHGTGGITLGRRTDDGTYPVYNWYPDELRHQNASVYVMSRAIKENPALINETFLTYANLTITYEEYESVLWALNNADDGVYKATIGDIISKRANVAWTTAGHSGEDVNLYSYGLRPENLKGVMNNIDVAASYIDQFNFGPTMAEITKNLSSMVFDPPSQYARKRHSYASHD